MYSRRSISLARQVIALTTCALALASLSAALHPDRLKWRVSVDDVRAVSIEEVAGPAETVLWIDARNADAFARGHIPGALPLNESRWEEQLSGVVGAWKPDMRIVVYCGGKECLSSESVARRLRRELGVDEIVVLSGGWDAWEARRR